ncbi:MAG: restriction endonuclease subunit S, partial [Candidatus Nanohalobium sp.]
MPKTEYKEVQIGPRKIDIPVEWETSLLKDVADIVSGSTPKKSQEEYWEGDIVWITPTDITENDSKYISDSEEKITQEGLESCSTHILEPGAVLMTSRATIGEASINTVEACTNQGFKSIVCGEELHNEYFYYYLPMIKDYLNAIGGGSTFPEINKTDTETIKLPLPPLPEQRRIAEILSTVDEAIQQTDEIIE